MSKRILILSPDVITERMAGPAIRYWEFAQQLSHVPVTLAIPNDMTSILHSHNITLVQHQQNNIDTLIQQHDIIIFQGYIFDIYPQLKSCNKILVTDLYDPVPLEGLEQHKDWSPNEAMPRIFEQVNMLNQQLELADYFLCASERQRDLWLGHLLALGRINPYTYQHIKQRVLIVPYGLPDTAPQRTGNGLRLDKADNRFILLWGGGIWQWFDPLTPIKAVQRLSNKYPHIQLIFLGTKHPNPTIPPMPMQNTAETLAKELGVYNKQVIFQAGWVPYNQVQNYFLDANVGISAHFDTLETHYSFRTRILHYLWTGKPIITTKGDIFAEHIQHYQAGIVVDYKSENAWIDAIEMMQDEACYAKYQQGVKQLAQKYYWSNITQPLKQLQQHATLSSDMYIDERHLRQAYQWQTKWQHSHEYSLLQDELKDTKQTVQALQNKINLQNQDYAALSQKLRTIENSNSWKLTAYLRNIRRKLNI
jgi:glycosyltransferase involved in cell wall biosynthesis